MLFPLPSNWPGLLLPLDMLVLLCVLLGQEVCSGLLGFGLAEWLLPMLNVGVVCKGWGQHRCEESFRYVGAGDFDG